MSVKRLVRASKLFKELPPQANGSTCFQLKGFPSGASLYVLKDDRRFDFWDRAPSKFPNSRQLLDFVQNNSIQRPRGEHRWSYTLDGRYIDRVIEIIKGRMTTNHELLSRITARPDVFGGKPIIRDMRISVDLVLSLLSQGTTQNELLDEYPGLEPEDIRACVAYAHAVIAGDSLEAVSVLSS